jgi:signal recognition particle subunit SRP19
MRKQEKVIVWPAYFDATRSRLDGRRVPKNLAVTIPRTAELKEAAEKTGLKCELVPEVGYPKTPWQKTGMLLVEKKGSKNQTILTIGKKLLEVRSAAKVEGN